jgi:hypothetical protein
MSSKIPPANPDVTTTTQKLNVLLQNRLEELHGLLKLEAVPQSQPGQGIVARITGLPAGGILQQPLPLGLNLDLDKIRQDLKGKVGNVLKEIKPFFKFEETKFTVTVPDFKNKLLAKFLFYKVEDTDGTKYQNVDAKQDPPLNKPGLPVINWQVVKPKPGVGGIELINLSEAPKNAVGDGVPGVSGETTGKFIQDISGKLNLGDLNGSIVPEAAATLIDALVGTLLDAATHFVHLPVSIPVEAEVKWSVREGKEATSKAVDEGDYRLTRDLNAPVVNVLLRPETFDWLDEDEPVAPVTRYLHALVRLKASDQAVEHPLAAIPIASASLGIPRILALFENMNFEGACLVMVPDRSPIPDISTLLEILAPLEKILSTLGTFAQLATLATGVGQLISAVQANPFLRFRKNVAKEEKIGDQTVTYEGFRNLDDITLKYNGALSDDLEADDQFSSLILIGNPGACVQCFNDSDFDADEGWFEVKVGAGFCALVRNLHFNAVSDYREVTIKQPPPGGAGGAIKGGGTFGDEMTSVRWATCD